MIIRQADGKTVVQPFAEKINLHVSDTISIEQTGIWEDTRDRASWKKAFYIHGQDSEGHITAVILTLDAETEEALEIEQA